MFNSPTIEEFIEKLKKIPGISKKQAEKIVFWVLNSNEEDVNSVSNYFKKVKERISFCQFCLNAKEDDLCYICNDQDRKNTLMIVESQLVIQKIENARFYNGKYFVFEKLLKEENDTQKVMQIISKLKTYCQSFDEVILAISPTLQGEITNALIKKELEPLNIKVSQLAIGVPIGASVDYMDEFTLKFALEHRQK
ncbi:toprim domain-containing protein [Mycoplasmopsis gallinacea]|uniref:Recombination protein RecR n=1 Tax=Mycoplasmopsis gallinacea TaxID=29556 RepID=A0A449A332_9BACT|nr:toprim domain-containing protein [Mycoplasmopsis gallinacea]VEU58622.1 recombination protein RecR [Mycoplasmopsis gallinacea]